MNQNEAKARKVRQNMGKKFTFIGAGSLGFTSALVRDLLTFEAFRDCELHLMDIHEERLNYIEKAIKKLIKVNTQHVVVEGFSEDTTNSVYKFVTNNNVVFTNLFMQELWFYLSND